MKMTALFVVQKIESDWATTHRVTLVPAPVDDTPESETFSGQKTQAGDISLRIGHGHSLKEGDWARVTLEKVGVPTLYDQPTEVTPKDDSPTPGHWYGN